MKTRKLTLKYFFNRITGWGYWSSCGCRSCLSSHARLPFRWDRFRCCCSHHLSRQSRMWHRHSWTPSDRRSEPWGSRLEGDKFRNFDFFDDDDRDRNNLLLDLNYRRSRNSDSLDIEIWESTVASAVLSWRSLLSNIPRKT